MYVWLCWVFVSVRGLSLVVASGGHSSSQCGGHSSSRCAGLSLSRPLVAEHRLQTRRLSSCGSRAELLRGMWDPPRPGLEPASPALAGRFSTTAPPEKPQGRLLERGRMVPWHHKIHVFSFQWVPHIPLLVAFDSNLRTFSSCYTLSLVSLNHPILYGKLWFQVSPLPWSHSCLSQPWIIFSSKLCSF